MESEYNFRPEPRGRRANVDFADAVGMVTISPQQDHDEQDELNDDVNDEPRSEGDPTEANVERQEAVTVPSGGSSVPRTDSNPGLSERVLEDTQSVPRGTSGISTPSHAKSHSSIVNTNGYKGPPVGSRPLSVNTDQGIEPERLTQSPSRVRTGDDFDVRPSIDSTSRRPTPHVPEYQPSGYEGNQWAQRPPMQHYVVAGHQGGWGDNYDNEYRLHRPRNRIDPPANPFGLKPRLPTFDGKGKWEAFMIQFDNLATRYAWDEDTRLGQIIACMEDGALEFISRLDTDTRNNFSSLIKALCSRYADRTPPEAHRASLSTLRKQPKEDMREFSSRVSEMVRKAYPGTEGTKLHTNLTIEHLLAGMSDQTLAYEVLTKKPGTVDEALNMITWYQCCKATKTQRSGIRKISELPDENEPKQQNGWKGNYVTEERLSRFEESLKATINENMKQLMTRTPQTGFKGQMNVGRSKNGENNERSKNLGPRELSGATQSMHIGGVARKASCFNCGWQGHYRKDCPASKYHQNRPSHLN